MKRSLVGVFEVIDPDGIPEIGAVVGDRIVLGATRPWPVALARELGHADARWAFSDRARLEYTTPDLPHSQAWQLLHGVWQRPEPQQERLRLLS